MTMQLGTFGAWFSPVYDDAARTAFVVEAEALGYTTAWLGLGARAMADLSLVERVLDATTTIVVATAIVNMWTNDAVLVARSYRRIAAKHPDRFLLGVGVSHPETIATYRSPLDTMATYLDTLEAGGVPQDRRVLAALGPRALQLAGARAAGTHPYLVVPDYTRHARAILGAAPLLAPEHKAVVSTDPQTARAIGRNFVNWPQFRQGPLPQPTQLRQQPTPPWLHGRGRCRRWQRPAHRRPCAPRHTRTHQGRTRGAPRRRRQPRRHPGPRRTRRGSHAWLPGARPRPPLTPGIGAGPG